MVASRRPLPFFSLLLGVVGLVGVARVAAAAPPPGDPAAVAKVTNLNKKALDAYGKQDYDTAKELLKQALDVCADAGLDQHPITARTHIHFGVVAIVGFKQHEVGVKQFRKAIEIEPDIKLTKSLVTPELQDAFEEAVLAGNGSGGSAPAAGDDNGGGAAPANAEGGEAAPGGDSDETPPPRRAVKPRKKHGDDDDDNGKDKDKDDEATGPGQKGSFFLGLTLGSGFGIAKGSGEVDPAAHTLAAAGFAFSQLGQVKPEIGYFVAPTVLLSVALRFQYINGLNGEVNTGCPNGFCKPYSTATSVLARLTYLATDGPLHFTVGGQIGGGYIRHAEAFNNAAKNCAPSAPAATDTSRQGCVDTIAGGPFLIGPTAGLMYEIGDSFDLIAGINTELGLSKFTFNIDIDVGIGLRL
jgi:hypothetical protein